MSFRCKVCSEAQNSGVGPVMLVTERREVNYPARSRGKKIIDPGGAGHETVNEIAVCAKCAETFLEDIR